MGSTDQIKVSCLPHVFSKEREDRQIERKSFRELIDEFKLPVPYENVLVIDLDTIIKDIDEVPKSDHVILKVVPAGGIVIHLLLKNKTE